MIKSKNGTSSKQPLAGPINETQPWPGFSILTFQMAGHEYGLPITNIIQIIEMVALTPLPEAPATIQGVFNLRGKIVPALDLRLHFGLFAQPYQLHTPIVLIDLAGQTLGLIVDQVVEVLEISSTDLEIGASIIPAELVSAQNGLGLMPGLLGIAKVKRRLIPILDIQLILSADEQIRLQQQLVLTNLSAEIENSLKKVQEHEAI